MITIKCDWICEYCYKPTVGDLPEGWSIIYSSAVCPGCLARVAIDGGINVVKGGAYSYMDDPRATKEKVRNDMD